jgi:hypothetical protein
MHEMERVKDLWWRQTVDFPCDFPLRFLRLGGAMNVFGVHGYSFEAQNLHRKESLERKLFK